MKTAVRRVLSLIFLALGTVPLVLSQTPDLEPNRQGAPVPIVSFDLVRPGVDPSHYSIAVESTGRAAYRAEDGPHENGDQKGQTPGEPYILKFTMADPNKTRIFELAKQANYFQGSFDYTKTKIANTGIKTLTFAEGHLPNDFEHPARGKQNQTTYNWSENPAIQELTRIFEGISVTLEFGRRVDFERRFDKLGLDAELKRMQEMQKSGEVQEVQAIAPILTNITNDVSVMHIARERARQILTAAGTK